MYRLPCSFNCLTILSGLLFLCFFIGALGIAVEIELIDVDTMDFNDEPEGCNHYSTYKHHGEVWDMYLCGDGNFKSIARDE